MKVRLESTIGFHFIVLICFLSVCFEGPKPSYGSDLLFNRSSFPADFLFGTGTSALQTEGAANIEGRTPSIWDTYIKNHPERIVDGSNADVATDFYFRYKDDVALMKKIGLSSFRFSISWSRVLPQGKIIGGVNQQGVDFYNNLINELISNGIEPFVSLVHFDLPQVLEDEYGGFLSPKIIKDYVDYAAFCFKQFGDRVKYWVTFNEPETYAQLGYTDGQFPPGRCSNFYRRCPAGNSSTEPYVAVHHLILCHATAAKLYKDNYQTSQNGFIGISIATKWAEPKFQTITSKKAASRYLDFQFGWIFHPITYGNYPKTMQDLVGDRLPKFTESQSEIIKGSADFIGLNYYTARYVEDAQVMNITFAANYNTDRRIFETTEKNGIPIGEQAGDFVYVYPKGIRKLLLYIKERYNSPTIYITENGVRDQALDDNFRIKFHRQHLLYLLQAIKNGVDVRGYYVWSLLDNFEWFEGYTARMGIIYIDYEDKLKRYPKKSALWFNNFLQKEDASISSWNLYYDQ